MRRSRGSSVRIPPARSSRYSLVARDSGLVADSSAGSPASVVRGSRAMGRAFAPIAKVTANLALHRRGDERGERDPSGWVEAGGRLDQADRAGLHEVVELLPAPRVAARHRADQRQMRPHELLPDGIARFGAARTLCRPRGRPHMCFALHVATSPRDRYHRERSRDSSEFAAFFGSDRPLERTLTSGKLIMADHLFLKFWGSWGAVALTLTVLAYLLIAPGRAQAAGPVPAVPSSVSTVVPAAAQAAVTAALAQASAVQAAAAQAIPVPQAPAAPVAPPASGGAGAPVPPVPAAPHVSSPPAVPAPPTAAAPSAGSQPAAVAPAAPGATAAPGAPPATRSAPGKTAGQRTVHRTPREPSRPGRATRRAVGWHPLPGVRTARRATPLPPLARLVLPTRSDVRPAVHVHRDAPPAGRTHRAIRSGAIARVIAPPAQLPASPALPPAGVEGAAAGGPGGAAGATAAALLALVGICLMRALLPGRLALGLAPWQSAQLVCRLERPG